MEIKTPSQEYLKTVLCYPTFNEEVFAERLSNLRDMGISELLSKGPSNISRWKILGKGHVGIVVAAKHYESEVALKILRTDADRTSLEREGLMLAYANTAEVGPKIIRCTKAFMISEFIDGISLMNWANSGNKLPQPERCARNLVFQGFRLDSAGIDHGELSRPDKHVLLQAEGSPVLIDFESASVNRRCNNLLSLVQFLFIRRTSLRTAFGSFHHSMSVEDLLPSLRAYKVNQSLKSYKGILKVLGL
jgi:putative serine/threonine protein kinase